MRHSEDTWLGTRLPTHCSFPADVSTVGPAACVVCVYASQRFRTLPGTFTDTWMSPALPNEHFSPWNCDEIVRGWQWEEKPFIRLTAPPRIQTPSPHQDIYLPYEQVSFLSLLIASSPFSLPSLLPQVLPGPALSILELGLSVLPAFTCPPVKSTFIYQELPGPELSSMTTPISYCGKLNQGEEGTDSLPFSPSLLTLPSITQPLSKFLSPSLNFLGSPYWFLFLSVWPSTLPH